MTDRSNTDSPSDAVCADGAADIGELDLLAYADGLLDGDPVRKAAVAAYLDENPELAYRTEVYARQNTELRERFNFRLAEPVPERHYTALRGPRHDGRGTRIAAGVMLLMAAGTAGWVAGTALTPSDQSPITAFIHEAITDFRGSMAKHGAGMVASSGDGDSQPLSWLSRQVAIELSAPDLTERGYQVIAKRRVTLANGQPAVRIVYESEMGDRLGLFLRVRWSDGQPEVQVAEADEMNAAYWLDGPMFYGLVAERGAANVDDVAAWIIGSQDKAPNLPQIQTAPPATAPEASDVETSIESSDKASDTTSSMPMPGGAAIPIGAGPSDGADAVQQ